MNRRDKGQVLVLVALAIFVLLGMAALAVDVGFTYSTKHELQRSADAGALAGASVFRDNGKDSTDPTTRDLAEARALDYATRDLVNRSRLKTLPGDVVSVSFPVAEPKRVRVDVNRTVDLFFARVFGRANQAIPAFAVAEAFPVSERVNCIVPWGIPAPWTDSDNDGVRDAGETVHWPPVEGECGTDTSPSPTVWNYTTHAISGTRSIRDQYMCQGSLHVMKIGDAHATTIPGNFYGLDLATLVRTCPEGVNINHGADFFRFMIKHPCDCDLGINVGDPMPLVTTEPGNMVGPTIKATAPTSYTQGRHPYINMNVDADSIMNQDPGAYWDTATNMPVSSNPAWQGDNWYKSPRVVRIPVYHPDASYNGGQNTPSAGRSDFQPLSFVGFWVQDIAYDSPNNGTVVGRFITAAGPGSGAGGGPGSAGTPVLNIRLVE